MNRPVAIGGQPPRTIGDHGEARLGLSGEPVLLASPGEAVQYRLHPRH